MNQEILNLIKESFLSEKEKLYLSKILELEGPTEIFFKKFEILITDEIKKIGESYKVVGENLNSDFINADKWLAEQKQVLEKEVEIELAKVNSTDIKKKTGIWKNYDNRITKLSLEYKERLDKVVSGAIASKIK